MTRIAVAAVSVLACAAFAQTPSTPKAKPSAQGEATGGWTPRKVTNPDKKGIEAMLTQMDKAWMASDITATASMVDFPVYMVTDDSKGTVSTDSWTKDMYMTNMTETMKNMPPDMKDMKVKHNRKIDFITDDIAIVHDDAAMTMGKHTMNIRNASLVIKKDGKWMVKSMMEGGWGDSMKPKAETKG